MMSLGEILFVYRARMRESSLLLQEALAVVGIAVGVALLFASQVASASLDGSVRALASQVVGSTQFQLDSRGNEGFNAQIARTVERLPGMETALPLLDQQATIIGPRGSVSIYLLGADPRFARSSGALLRRFTSKQLEHQQALAVPAPLAAQIGAGALQTVKLQIGARVTESLIGTTLGVCAVASTGSSSGYAPDMRRRPGQPLQRLRQGNIWTSPQPTSTPSYSASPRPQHSRQRDCSRRSPRSWGSSSLLTPCCSPSPSAGSSLRPCEGAARPGP